MTFGKITFISPDSGSIYLWVTYLPFLTMYSAHLNRGGFTGVKALSLLGCVINCF